MHGDDVLYAVGGAVAPLLGAVIGLIDLPTMATAVALSAAGAVTSWSVKQALDCLKSKLKK